MVDKVTTPTSEALRAQRRVAFDLLVSSVHELMSLDMRIDSRYPKQVPVILGENAKKFAGLALEESRAANGKEHIRYDHDDMGLGEDIWWDRTARLVVLRGVKTRGYWNSSATLHNRDETRWDILFRDVDVSTLTEQDTVSFSSHVERTQSVAGSEELDTYLVDFIKIDFNKGQVVSINSTKNALLGENQDVFAPKEPGQLLSTQALHGGLLSINL